MGLETTAAALKRERAERERRQIQWEADKRREQERLELIRQEESRAKKLIADVTSWETATRIRSYIQELESIEAKIPGLTDWISWAISYADKIDPLKSPHSLIFVEEPPIWM